MRYRQQTLGFYSKGKGKKRKVIPISARSTRKRKIASRITQPSKAKVDNLVVSKPKLQQAIAKAEKDNPNFWQAEIVEIAMIPSVTKAIEEMTHRKLNLTRVKTKFGNGYVLEGWNSVRDDYYSTNPAKVYDGLRREYIGIQDLELLRQTAHGHDSAKDQLRHFKIKDSPKLQGMEVWEGPANYTYTLLNAQRKNGEWVWTVRAYDQSNNVFERLQIPERELLQGNYGHEQTENAGKVSVHRVHGVYI